MKAAIGKSKSARKMVTNNNSENPSSDGWEGFDDDEVDVDVDNENDASNDVDGNIDFEKIESAAQLAVDLRKALAACEQLTEQLTKSETERDEVSLWVAVLVQDVAQMKSPRFFSESIFSLCRVVSSGLFDWFIRLILTATLDGLS